MSASNHTKCSFCGYIRNEGDAMVLESICPSCGRVYVGKEPVFDSSDPGASGYIEYEETSEYEDGLRNRFLALLLPKPKEIDFEIWMGSVIGFFSMGMGFYFVGHQLVADYEFVYA